MPQSCSCHEALQHTFATVREAVYGAQDKDVILANADLIARSDEKWLRLYRCRTCGTEWAEACYSSGHMEIYYLFPAPPTGDSIRWLHEEAAGLPPPSV
ncbi:MAG: hypothetical protein H6631_13395 [Anaerolineaceae bacterium]|nr:hypothetical protein [Anaerolineaceae bacterium]MCB9101226.1 hypothetical protein [Anaerolineales bacterium]